MILNGAVGVTKKFQVYGNAKVDAQCASHLILHPPPRLLGGVRADSMNAYLESEKNLSGGPKLKGMLKMANEPVSEYAYADEREAVKNIGIKIANAGMYIRSISKQDIPPGEAAERLEETLCNLAEYQSSLTRIRASLYKASIS